MSCRMLKALKTALFLICCLSLLPTPSVLAQGGVGVGGDRPSAKTRRFPFKVVVTGFLNTGPGPGCLGSHPAGRDRPSR